MKEFFTRLGIMAATVIIILMAAVAIVLVHITKFILKIGLIRNSLRPAE